MNFNNYTWKIFVLEDENEIKKMNRRDWVFDYGSEISKGEIRIPSFNLEKNYDINLEFRM